MDPRDIELMKKLNARQTNLILGNIATVVLATNPLFAKLIQIPAGPIIFVRMCSAGLVLSLFLFWTNQWKTVKKSDWKQIGLSSCLNAINFLFFYVSIQLSTVAIGITTLFLFPLMTALIEPFILKTRFSKVQVLLSALIFTGVGILAYGSHDVHGNILAGLIVGCIAAFAFSLRNILLRPLLQSYPSMMLMCIQMFIGAILLSPFAPALADASSMDWIYMLIVGILGTAVGHTLFVHSMNHLSASTAGIIVSGQVPIAIGISWVLLGEHVNLEIVLGSAIIMAVVILENIIKKNEAPVDPKKPN